MERIALWSREIRATNNQVKEGKKKTQKRKAIHARADAEMVTAGESI